MIRGQEDLPYQVLTSRDGIYFSSIVLSMWDNIHGPKILMTWKGSESVQKKDRGGKHPAVTRAEPKPFLRIVTMYHNMGKTSFL